MSAKLTVVSSGSIGNHYILECNGERLILELGIKWRDIIKALDYNISNVVGCLCSHRHKDHAFSVPAALSYGLKVYSCAEVASLYPQVKVLEPKKRYVIGEFKIMALPVPHNAECYAYHIQHPEMGTLLFATDASTLPYFIKGINFLCIEANYSEDLIVDRLCEGKDVRGTRQDHMEINETINVIKCLQSPELCKVVLLHLSDANSDESLFKRHVWQECGIECECADSGKVYELTKDEF